MAKELNELQRISNTLAEILAEQRKQTSAQTSSQIPGRDVVQEQAQQIRQEAEAQMPHRPVGRPLEGGDTVTGRLGTVAKRGARQAVESSVQRTTRGFVGSTLNTLTGLSGFRSMVLGAGAAVGVGALAAARSKAAGRAAQAIAGGVGAGLAAVGLPRTAVKFENFLAQGGFAGMGKNMAANAGRTMFAEMRKVITNSAGFKQFTNVMRPVTQGLSKFAGAITAAGTAMGPFMKPLLAVAAVAGTAFVGIKGFQMLGKLSEKLSVMNTAALGAQRQFSVSPAMAAVFADFERREMLSRVSVGNRTAESTRRLAESSARLNNIMRHQGLGLGNFYRNRLSDASELTSFGLMTMIQVPFKIGADGLRAEVPGIGVTTGQMLGFAFLGPVGAELFGRGALIKSMVDAVREYANPMLERFLGIDSPDKGPVETFFTQVVNEKLGGQVIKNPRL